MTKHTRIHLPEPERTHLQQLIAKGNAPARVQTRARILLLTDHSQNAHRPNPAIAAALLCAPATVFNVCRRYRQEGLHSALYEKPRPGAVPKITGEVEAKIILLACSAPPEGHAHWTLRLLAEKSIALGFVAEVSHVTIGELLKKTRSNLGVCKRGASASPPPNT